MRTVALFSCVSFALASAWGGQSGDFESQVASARDEAAFHKAVQSPPANLDEDTYVSSELERAADTSDWKTAQSRVVDALRLKRFAESTAQEGRVVDPKAEAAKILSRPVFRDPGDKKDRNWLSDSIERLARAISEFFAKLFQPRQAGAAPVIGLNMAALEPVVWTVLILGLLVFAGVFITKFSIARRKGKAGGSLLAEDEPDLNADEWLVKAEGLEAAGEFREAVRCLYLASLRRLDESGHLMFVRTETNWEHLRRFEADPGRPQSLDLRTQTREFDRVWYGYQVHGASDVALFREFYRAVLSAIGRRP